MVIKQLDGELGRVVRFCTTISRGFAIRLESEVYHHKQTLMFYTADLFVLPGPSRTRYHRG